MTNKIKKPKTMFYDIETGLLKFVGFSLGEQQIRHGQLLKGFNKTPIICLSYAIDNGPVKSIVYDIATAGCANLIKEFDALVKTVDVVIGKNSDRFDNKHINTHRMLADLPGFEDWKDKTDDLERQMRRYFYLPSQSLDYISEVLGLGGKIKMDFSDWVDILQLQSVEQLNHRLAKHTGLSKKKILNDYTLLEYNKNVDEIFKNGGKALEKMVYYNKKDVRDTRQIWNYCVKHFKPKFNVGAFKRMNGNKVLVCRSCGSNNIHKNGRRPTGQTIYQQFFCNSHGGTAGRIVIRADGTFNPNGILS